MGIIGAVGYGRRQLRAPASKGASTETAFLHEVVNRCGQRDPSDRPSPSILQKSFQRMSQVYEQKRAKRGVLGKLGDKTETFLASNLFSGSLQRSLYGSDMTRAAGGAATVAPGP